MADRFRIRDANDQAENDDDAPRRAAAKRPSHRKSRRPQSDQQQQLAANEHNATHAITSYTALPTSTKVTPLKKSSASDSNLKLARQQQQRHSHRKSRQTDDSSRHHRHSTRRDADNNDDAERASQRRHSHRTSKSQKPRQQQVNDDHLNVTTPTNKPPRKSRTKSRAKRKSTGGDTTPSIILFNADIGEAVNTAGPLALPRSVTNSRRPSVTSRRASPTNVLGSSAPLRTTSASKVNEGSGGKASKPRRSRNDNNKNGNDDDRHSTSAYSTNSRRTSRQSSRRKARSKTRTSSARPASTTDNNNSSSSRRRRRDSSTYYSNIDSSPNPSVTTAARRNARRHDSPASVPSRYNLPKSRRASRRATTRRKTRRTDSNKPSSPSTPSLLLTAAINTEYEKCLPEAVQDIYQILTDLGYTITLDPGSSTTAETFVNALSKQTALLRSAVAETEAKCQLLKDEKALEYEKTDQLQSSIYYLEKSIEKHAQLLRHKTVKADSIRHDKQQLEHLAAERVAEADIEFDKRKRVLRQRAREREQASKQLNSSAEQLAACVEQLRAQTAEDEAKFAFITKRLGQWTNEKQQMRQVVCDLRARAQQEQADHEEMQQRMLQDFAALDEECREIKEREQNDTEKSRKARQVYEAQLEHLQTQQQYGARELAKATEQLDCVGGQYEQALSKAKRDMIMEFEKLFARGITNKLDLNSSEDNYPKDGRGTKSPMGGNAEASARQTSLFNSSSPSSTNPARPSADPLSSSANPRPMSAMDFPRFSSPMKQQQNDDMQSASTPIITTQTSSPEQPSAYSDSRNIDSTDEQRTSDEKFEKMRSLAEKTEALIQELNRRMFTNNQNASTSQNTTENAATTSGIPTPPAFAVSSSLATTTTPKPEEKISNFLRSRLSEQHPQPETPRANRDQDDLASVGTYTLLNHQQGRTSSFVAPTINSRNAAKTDSDNYAEFSARLPPQPSSTTRFSTRIADEATPELTRTSGVDRKSNNYSYFLPLAADANEERRRSTSRKSTADDGRRNFASFLSPGVAAPENGNVPPRPSVLPPSFTFRDHANRLSSTSRRRNPALVRRIENTNARNSTSTRSSQQPPTTRVRGSTSPCPRYYNACNIPPSCRTPAPYNSNNACSRRNVSRFPRPAQQQQVCRPVSRNATPFDGGACDRQKNDAIAKIRAAAAAEEHRLSIGRAATDEPLVDSPGTVARHIEMLLRKYPRDVRANC